MKNGRMQISCDIGGVISKYPNVFRDLLRALAASGQVDLWILTDMHIHDQSVSFVHGNGFDFIPAENILNSDYAAYGELCKAKVIEEYGIDLHIDDFPGYVAEGKCVRLFVWPDPHKPYFADDFITDGSEGNFGRRIKPKSEVPKEPS